MREYNIFKWKTQLIQSVRSNSVSISINQISISRQSVSQQINRSKQIQIKIKTNKPKKKKLSSKCNSFLIQHWSKIENIWYQINFSKNLLVDFFIFIKQANSAFPLQSNWHSQFPDKKLVTFNFSVHFLTKYLSYVPFIPFQPSFATLPFFMA